MHDPILGYTTDEVYIDSWKEMAVCVDSILMVGLECAVVFFWHPRNDKILVQRVLFIQIVHILTVVIY